MHSHDPLIEKLFAAGRAKTPADTVPLGFGARVRARLSESSRFSENAREFTLRAWANGLCRAAMGAGAVCALALTLSSLQLPKSPTDSDADADSLELKMALAEWMDSETEEVEW